MSTPKPATILFVDDEPSILSALNRLFRPQGYRVLMAESGENGLALLQREQVDLVVSDMRMPGMDGAAFLAETRRRHPEIGRILLTGYADITATIAAINEGAIERYVAKPWNDAELSLAVRDAVERLTLKREHERLTALVRQQNVELEQRVAERTAELAQANTKLSENFQLSIQVFASLLELRNQGSAGHSRQAAELARRVAAALELEPSLQEEVHAAALLHEIGKIGLPDALLQKPESLMTPEELGRYRKYPMTGESALLPLTDLHNVAHLVRSHQERFDGRGFPDGLAGLQIPVAAQVVGIAVTYQNLLDGRASPRRHSPDDARGMLTGMAGARYAPAVVQALLKVLNTAPEPAAATDRELGLHELQAGMVLSRDLLSPHGMLLLAKGHVFSARVIEQLRDLAQRHDQKLRLHVELASIPVAEPA